ncbi:unnamed protein product [Symbiodinium sp. CCMP2456]|nr:unnamed protein product [Symbiodinium sp. CCMP2456]
MRKGQQCVQSGRRPRAKMAKLTRRCRRWRKLGGSHGQPMLPKTTRSQGIQKVSCCHSAHRTASQLQKQTGQYPPPRVLLSAFASLRRL